MWTKNNNIKKKIDMIYHTDIYTVLYLSFMLSFPRPLDRFFYTQGGKGKERKERQTRKQEAGTTGRGRESGGGLSSGPAGSGLP